MLKNIVLLAVLVHGTSLACVRVCSYVCVPVCVYVFVWSSVCILNLQAAGELVTDLNPHLTSCCELLELILRKGLQREYWPLDPPLDLDLTGP